MQIDIWSDIVCPFCYIGKRSLEHALEAFEHRDKVSVRWHSFELDTQAPERDPRPMKEILAAKYGHSIEQTEAMQQRVIKMGAEGGLDLRLNESIRINSFMAHRILHLAASHQLQNQAKERMMQAYFTEGEDLSNPDTLIRLMDEIGLEEALVRDTIESGAFATTVRDDESAAHELGVTGVPFFLIDDKYTMSGAQPVTVFLEVLNKVWTDSHEVVGPEPEHQAS